jgi:cytochrome b561
MKVFELFDIILGNGGIMLTNTVSHYGLVSIILHWITALAVFGLFGLGFWMVELSYYDSYYRAAPALHKSIGLTLALIILLRLFWRAYQLKPTPLISHSPMEQKAAVWVHGTLYLLMFITMLSGYFISTADNRAIEVFGLVTVPSMGAFLDNQEDLAGVIHKYLAYLMVAIATLHALAALKHHFFDKDKTLLRMLKPGKHWS